MLTVETVLTDPITATVWVTFVDTPRAIRLAADEHAALVAHAFKPLRDLHRPVQVHSNQGETVCHTCWNSVGHFYLWPCPSARHLYTSEELSR